MKRPEDEDELTEEEKEAIEDLENQHEPEEKPEE